MKRKINQIIIHCSATPEKMDIDAETIRKWHTAKGWSDIGYHYVIKRNGDVQDGRPVERIGAHCRGYNSYSIGVCLVGGVDEYNDPQDNFTEKQMQSLVRLLKALRKVYPEASIHGHNEFSNKACPSFDVQKWLNCVRLSDD